MKVTLFALFIGLLMVGHEGGEPGSDSPQSKDNPAEIIDLDSPKTLNKILADAIDFHSLQMNSGLFLDPQKEAKYTGWAKWVLSNGHAKYLVRLKDGKQDGPNIWWYKNGHKRSEDNWKANRQDGLSITYNEDGTQRERTTWKDGKLMTAIVWKPDGEECPTTNVLKGNGIVIRYNMDGSQKTRFTYQKGELVSQTLIEEKSLSERIDNIDVDNLLELLGSNSNTYDIEALLAEAEKLSSSQEVDEMIDLDDPKTLNKILADAIEFDSLQMDSGFFLDPQKEAKYTGWAKKSLANGHVETLTQYKYGKQDGLGRKWYESGQKMSEGNYKDGKLNGLATIWQNRLKRLETNYKDGKRDGLETIWNENGLKKLETNYKDGKRNGLTTMWCENGLKSMEGNLKDGKEDGLWVFYIENGTKESRLTFKDGKQVEN